MILQCRSYRNMVTWGICHCRGRKLISTLIRSWDLSSLGPSDFSSKCFVGQRSYIIGSPSVTLLRASKGSCSHLTFVMWSHLVMKVYPWQKYSRQTYETGLICDISMAFWVTFPRYRVGPEPRHRAKSLHFCIWGLSKQWKPVIPANEASFVSVDWFGHSLPK